jgi:peroxiredoxin
VNVRRRPTRAATQRKTDIMHCKTVNFNAWKLATLLLVICGCAPPDPEAPKATASATNPAPKTSPAKRQTVDSAPQQAEVMPTDPADEEEPLLVSPANDPTTAPTEPIAQVDETEPRGRTAFYRGDTGPAEIPPVVFSKGHEALCRIKVGDTMPEIVLPRVGNGGDETNLADLAGEKATVVVFWKSDRRMAREQLGELHRDVIDLFGGKGVAVIGIAVDESDESAEAVLQRARVEFPNLLDPDGDAFAKVGTEKLPRTYLLDPIGKILWFDIEYSLSTRRELHQALRAVTDSR